jgi:hypothetical protein
MKIPRIFITYILILYFDMIRRRPLPKQKHKAGRKGYFQPWMINEARELIGKLGARVQDLAEYFEVDINTVNYWIRTKPEFARAVKRGRLEAALKAAKALFQKAVGFSHPDVQIMQYKGNPVIVPYIKHYPPDAYAAHKYLTIIFREVWADTAKIEHKHSYSGSIDVRSIESIALNELTKEQQELLFQLNLKQLTAPSERSN